VPQRQANGFDFLGGAVAQIGQGAVFDLPALPIRFAQQIPGIGLAVSVDGGYIDVHSGYAIPTKNRYALVWPIFFGIQLGKIRYSGFQPGAVCAWL
jgi:hypothetical protein